MAFRIVSYAEFFFLAWLGLTWLGLVWFGLVRWLWWNGRGKLNDLFCEVGEL